MVIKRLLLFVLCMTMTAETIFAQEESESGQDVWLCPFGEVLMYSISSPSFGGGLSFGYGSGVSIGIKAAFFIDLESLSTIEITFLLRAYFLGANAYSGPFLQLSVGPSLFFKPDDSLTVPSELGMISAGLGFGWRFLLKNRWFIEPAIRGGYPFIAGGGFSAGVRF